MGLIGIIRIQRDLPLRRSECRQCCNRCLILRQIQRGSFLVPERSHRLIDLAQLCGNVLCVFLRWLIGQGIDHRLYGQNRRIFSKTGREIRIFRSADRTVGIDRPLLTVGLADALRRSIPGRGGHISFHRRCRNARHRKNHCRRQ